MKKWILFFICYLILPHANAQSGDDGEGSTKVCLNLEGSYPQSEFLRCVPEPRKPCDMPRPCGGRITHKYANQIGYHKAPRTKKLAYNCAEPEYLPGCDPNGDVGNCPKRCNRWMPPACHLQCKKCLIDYHEYQAIQRGCLCPNRCCSVAPGEHPSFPGYFRVDDNEIVRCNNAQSCANVPTECRIDGQVVECPPGLDPPTVTEETCPAPSPQPRPPDRLCQAEIAYEQAVCSGTPP